MSVRVRPFAERDYTALARIRSTGEQIATTPDAMRADDERWDWSRFERIRVVAVDEEDAPLGYGELYQEPARFDPRRYFLRGAVDLRMRRRGIGAAIWTALKEQLDERQALGVYVSVRDATAGAAFIARRGFREVIRFYNQVLAVASAPQMTPSTEERLTSQGIRIAPLTELMREDPSALMKTYAMYYASRTDQPTLGRVTSLPFEMWRAQFIDEPDVLLDAYFIAVAGEEYVGQTNARPLPAGDVLDIGVTSVLPAYRGRGIARALKLRLHAYGRARGYREIHTSTARENKAMSGLNDALGYVIVESYAGYELTLTTAKQQAASP